MIATYQVSLVGTGRVGVTLWLESDSFDQAARVARRMIGQEFRVVSTRTVWCSTNRSKPAGEYP